MRSLQQRFCRMEETVRSLLQSQGCPEQKKEETVKIMAYQERLSEEERKHQETRGSIHVVSDEDSRSKSSCSDQGKDKTKLLLERLKALEAENSALALENENQREQYERCLDEVANQVVQALLTQKDLREECVKLKTRVFDLEQQNRTLSILFQQRVRPASDLLLQKLHSRVVDLSSGDLISEAGRSRSMTQSWTDIELHEHLQNAKSGSPTLKHPGSAVGPSHLCPHSCSSSELSLSSTCSEYSSGSSYTCQDGRHLEKRQSSQNWDQRLSVDSSLPSGFASPADELPPTRIKESHILEGLRKLQKRKVLLEPPSMITKWGYKDCMNSNEGIYSPGIKSNSLKEYAPCQPPGMGSSCKDLCKTFAFDTDSHEDADEDSPSSALPQAAVSQGCRMQGNRLTHSLSDSLFSWEPHGKHFSEGTALVYTRERPKRLIRCASHWPLERKLCPSMHMPRVQRDRDLHSHGHDHVALNLQHSDTDDTETLGELHIDSSDERSPSDLSLTMDTDKSMENLDVGFGKTECGLHCKEEEQPAHLDMRPKTFSFIRQQRVVKKTSSEECITVIFDVENGKPLEFSSHQTGTVTVTRDEVSINTTPTEPTDEHTELSQGITHLQPGANTRDYPFLRRPEEKTGKDIPKDEENSIPIAPTDSFSPGTAETQITPQPKLPKLTHSVACQSNCKSLASTGIYQKQGRTKIPSRGKSSPQKSKMVGPAPSIPVPPSDLVTLEKSPASPSGKFSPYMKTECPGALCDVGPDPHIPKHSTQLPHIPKMSSKRDWTQCPKNQAVGIWSRSLIGTGNNGESPMRDKHCSSGPEIGVRSPPPPPPPGRSVSLLVKPGYNHSPLPSSAKPETRLPSDTVSSAFKSSALKGSSADVISSLALSEIQRKRPSTVFTKPAFPPTLPSREAVMHNQNAERSPSSSFAIMAPGPPKVPPKAGIQKPSPHQALGTAHMNAALQTPKTCPSTHKLLDISASESLSSGRKGQLSDSTTTPHRPSFPGVNESPSSQVNSPSFSSSSSCKNQSTSQSYQNPPEKGPKTRLPVGLKVLMKSPHLLRKSCTVPGKQEKDSLNEASRSSVAASKSKPEDSRDPAHLETTENERNTTLIDLQVSDSLTRGLPLESALPESSEGSIYGADGRDGIQNRSVKRSFSSSKPHLKPALGMNGAKARSQSFSVHSGEKLSTATTEGPGKIRTQIITNTAERGSSLTRQNISTEGSPSKSPFSLTSESLPSAGRPLGHSFSRQGSLSSTGSSSSQHGSPNKFPLRIPTRSEGLLTPPRMDDQQVYTQEECPRAPIPEEASSDQQKYPPTKTNCPQSLQVSGRMHHSNHLETSRIPKLETSGMRPDASPTGTGVGSPEAPLTPSIEEKVMLCIQENVEKGQAQTKPTSVEAKPRAGPSFASWFGFRKSRLPALSSKKMDASKSKMEKKDTKLKSERKKEKKTPEGQSKSEKELTRGTKLADGLNLDNGLQSRNNLKTSQDMYNQMKLEPRNRLSPLACSAKDTFMMELLNRVDKKATPETESGSNSVSCRSMLKGTSQGSCFASDSVSTQGSQKKTVKAEADMEAPRESLVTEVDEDLREDEEDTVANSALQSHIIESNCQMRTLDSGIGTFPLPDSGTRSTARYICQQDSREDSEPLLPPQPASSTASSARAQTLEREVPSSTDNQRSSESSIIHSISDPGMMARGMQAPQSHQPKPTSSGKTSLQKQNGSESRPQTCPSFQFAGDTMAREPLPGWRGEDAAAETQELKQVEETKEDPKTRLSKISLESFNKFNSNTVILLENENSQSRVAGQKEERERNEAVSLSSSDRPVLDNLESLSDSLYDSFSSCVSQTSNDM